jgi:hypothetical protein
MTADAKGAVLTMLASVVDTEPKWWRWSPTPAERAIAAALLVLVNDAAVAPPEEQP